MRVKQLLVVILRSIDGLDVVVRGKVNRLDFGRVLWERWGLLEICVHGQRQGGTVVGKGLWVGMNSIDKLL